MVGDEPGVERPRYGCNPETKAKLRVCTHVGVLRGQEVLEATASSAGSAVSAYFPNLLDHGGPLFRSCCAVRLKDGAGGGPVAPAAHIISPLRAVRDVVAAGCSASAR